MFERLIIRSEDNAIVRLEDVADVELGSESYQSSVTFNGKQATFMGIEVATGRTLRDNGLVAIEDLFQSTARLVGHPLSLRLDTGELGAIVDAMRLAQPVGAMA